MIRSIINDQSFFRIIVIAVLFFSTACYKSFATTELVGSEAKDTELYGIDNKGSLYSIHAKSVVETSPNQYKLNSIYSKYYHDSDKNHYMNLLSQNGTFDAKNNLLHLYTDVELSFSEGYRMLTNILNIDFARMVMFTQEQVEIHSVKGKIFAKNGLKHYINEKKIYFSGPITSILASN